MHFTQEAPCENIEQFMKTLWENASILLKGDLFLTSRWIHLRNHESFLKDEQNLDNSRILEDGKENGKTYNNILGKKESGLMQRQCQCLIEITAETDDKVISMSYS